MHYELPKGKKLPITIEANYDIFLSAPGSQYDLIAKLVAEKLGLLRDHITFGRKYIYSGSVTAEELEQLQDPAYQWYGRVPTAQFVAHVSQPNHRPYWKWLDDGEYAKGAGLTFWLRLMEDIGSYRPIYAELYFLSTEGWTRLRREEAGLFGTITNVRACYEQLRLHAEMLIDLEAIAIPSEAIAVAAE